MKINLLRISFFVFFGLFLFAQKSFAATADHLVISQVQITGGTGLTANDFIELYNPTNQDIDLSGMKLVKWTKTGTTDTSLITWGNSDLIKIIKAHGYYLWANVDYGTIGVLPDATRNYTISPDNAIALKDTAGNIVDAVAWGQPEHAFIEGIAVLNFDASSINMAIERKSGNGNGNGEDSNDNAADFFLQVAPHPRNSQSPIEPALSSSPPLPDTSPLGTSATSTSSTSFAANPPTFNLQISEIMPNPKGADSGAEWVEFYNPGAAAFDLAGWILDDDSLETLPGSGFYQIAEPAIAPAGGYLAITIPSGHFALNNSGDEAVRLFDSGKLLRLRQSFAGPAKEGQSYAKNWLGEWALSQAPTPGAANSFSAPPPPAAATLQISEALPNPPGEDQDGEFIELYNFGEDSIELAGWTVADSRKRYAVAADDFDETEMSPHSYFALYREITGISLNNSGTEEIKLFDPAGELVDKIIFDAASHDAAAYAHDFDKAGSWIWTLTPTPGLANQFSEAASSPSSKPNEPKPIADESAAPEVSLHDIREQPLNSTVTTTGTVSVPFGVFGEEVAYLAGSGIRVVWADPPAMSLRLGDTIRIIGKLTSHHNELQIAVSDEVETAVVKSGENVSAKAIATGEVGEGTEGFLVQLAGAVIKNSGDVFYLDDGSGEAKIYIRSSTGIDKPPIKKGQQVQITGIVSQYDDSYRVMPRFQSDITAGEVLGAVAAGRTLPRTGVNFWLMFAFFASVVIIGVLELLIRKDTKSEQS